MTWNDVSQLLTALAVVGTFVRGVLSDRKIISKVDEIHKTTNGMSERNEAIAKKLGVAEGKAQAKQDAETRTG